MLLTMQSVDDRLQSVDSPSLSAVAREAARGALFGARGNSGVIFSQFLAGFAQGLEDVEAADPDTLANALASGSKASYDAVSQPVEGTMLTVLRGFAEGASDRSDDEEDVLHLWNSALDQAKDALAKTPTMLPVLRDAGVIDSGGQGVVVIMEGFLCSFLEEDPEDYDIELSSPTRRHRRDARRKPGIPRCYPVRGVWILHRVYDRRRKHRHCRPSQLPLREG